MACLVLPIVPLLVGCSRKARTYTACVLSVHDMPCTSYVLVENSVYYKVVDELPVVYKSVRMAANSPAFKL